MELVGQSENRHTRERLSLRTLLMLMLMGAAVVFLSACEAKVNTGLAIKSDGSGVRTMVVEFADADNENNEYLNATPEQVDASIKKHLPEQLTHNGVTHDGKAMKTTFTLTFESVADYYDKVEKLMALSGEKPGGQSAYLFLDSPLQEGKAVYEDFDSTDLLKWMPAGLADDGYLAKENVDQALGSGSNKLSIDGKDMKSEYESMMYYNDTKGTGFSTVGFGTAIDGEVKVRRIILAAGNEESYKKNKKRFDAYFAELKNKGLEATRVENNDLLMWAVEFRGTEAEIAEKTNQVLYTQDATFSLEHTLKEGTKDTVVTTLNEFASCGQICLDSAKVITDYITINEGMKVSDSFEQTEQRTTGISTARGADKFYYDSTLNVSSPRYELDFGPNSESTLTASFAVPTSQAKVYGDFVSTLVAGESGASATAKDGEKDTTYSLTFAGKDPADLTSQLQKWLGKDANVSVAKGKNDSFFVENFHYAATLPAPSFIAQDVPVETVVTFDKGLPLDASTVAGEGKKDATAHSATFANAGGATLSADTSERTAKGLATIISGAVLLVLAIAALVFGILRKKRKGSGSRANSIVEASGTSQGSIVPVPVPSSGVDERVGSEDLWSPGANEATRSGAGTHTASSPEESDFVAPAGGRPSSEGAITVGTPASGSQPKSVPPIAKSDQPPLKASSQASSASPDLSETRAFELPLTGNQDPAITRAIPTQSGNGQSLDSADASLDGDQELDEASMVDADPEVEAAPVAESGQATTQSASSASAEDDDTKA